jgi:bifunctional UDP-N-acetylglucosamine pyrophosphorylase/glucosamine-1-phosphate N-acetyltransferase
LNGSGSAAQACENALKGFDGRVVIVYGDVMLNSCPHTLPALIEASTKNSKGLTLLSATLEDATGFGRFVKKGGAWRVVEEKDCTPAQRKLKQANPGIYALPAKTLWPLLHKLTPHNAQKELYLTDIIELAAKAKMKVAVEPVEATRSLMGINTREELSNMETEVQNQLRKMHMLNGATLINPPSIYFAMDTVIGRDVTIGPAVMFGPNVKIEDGVTVHAYCHITGATLKRGAIVGPFARVRPGSSIGENAHIGNFVEIKNSVIGDGSKANHLSYVGDATVGAAVNLGAGTITANYNKKTGKKSKTVIGDGASTGSQTVLVAPVTLGANAATGAGTVVRSDVEDGALAVAKPHIIIKGKYNT